jgi:hypothetical protein
MKLFTTSIGLVISNIISAPNLAADVKFTQDVIVNEALFNQCPGFHFKHPPKLFFLIPVVFIAVASLLLKMFDGIYNIV